MAASLTKEQGLALVKRLAEDDGFRALFEKDPASALTEIGMSVEEVAQLAEKCLVPCQVAPKQDFMAVQKSLNEVDFHAAMEMMVPRARL